MTDPPCDLCGAQRALVFCASDAACLCLPCDHQVHSANPLSHRHLRAPLCDRCRCRNSPVPPRPAAVRCPDCGLSCCIACELGCPGPGAGHRSARHVVPYSGCPSPAELSVVLDSSGAGVGTTMTTPINDKCDSTCWDEDPRVTGVDGGKQHQGVLLYKESKLNMLSNPLCNGVDGLGDRDELCEGFNSVEVDGFHMENMDEILEWWKDGGQNGLFMEDYNISIANSNSNGHIDNTLEASTSIQTDWASLPSVSGSLHAVDINADQLVLNLSCTRNNTLSSLTGESSIIADYQECRAPPMFLVGDSPWDSNHEISSTPEARNEAKMRYNEKKKSRLFGKQIRYASRKARADTRKRVRGRFVKAGEAYDYDPLEAKR